MTVQALSLSGGGNRPGMGNADLPARLAATLGDACRVLAARLAPPFGPHEPEPAGTPLKTGRLRMLLADVAGWR